MGTAQVWQYIDRSARFSIFDGVVVSRSFRSCPLAQQNKGYPREAAGDWMRKRLILLLIFLLFLLFLLLLSPPLSPPRLSPPLSPRASATAVLRRALCRGRLGSGGRRH